MNIIYEPLFGPPVGFKETISLRGWLGRRICRPEAALGLNIKKARLCQQLDLFSVLGSSQFNFSTLCK